MNDWIPVVATVLAGFFALVGYFLNQQGARRERKTEQYAQALRAVKAAEELPYRIRRRADSRPETRERIGGVVDDVFEQIGFFQAWLTLDNPRVGAAYVRLSAQSLLLGEPQRGEAWAAPPVASDPEAHINDMYHHGTEQEWKECLLAMQRELQLIPAWAEFMIRRPRREILASSFMKATRSSLPKADGSPASS